MSNRFAASILAIAMLSASSSAMAAITSTTSQAGWLASVNAVATDTYGDLSVQLYANPLLRTVGSYGYTASAVSGLFPGNDGGIFMSTNTATDSISFTSFTGGATAVGGFFFGSNAGGLFTASPSITVVVTTASDSLSTTITNPTQGSFLGFTADSAITGVTITALQPGDATFRWPSVDDFSLGLTGAGVPEPSSWAMLIAGFGLVGAVSRRRRSVVA